MHHHSTLDAVCRELQRKYSAHTILLYGSRANGTATDDSDIDIAAFAPVSTMFREADLRDGVFIDTFVYPETELDNPCEEYLRLLGSKILNQKGDLAERFLISLQGIYAAGPNALSGDELSARRVWAEKMAKRIRRNDSEGNYRRVWLLTALLEDYFHLRNQWYEGPKKALAWLKTNDPNTRDAIDQALKPDADIAAIEEAVASVLRTK